MPKPNYAFAKRQRDLIKKQKNDEKRQRKATAPATPASNTAESAPKMSTRTAAEIDTR